MARRRRFWNYPRPNKGPVQRWLPSWRIVVGTGLTGTALGAGLFVAAWSTTTIPDNLDSINQQATTVYWANGKKMGTFAEEKREKIKLADLPEYVGNAVVASEDETFWTNKGVDVKGIGRAVLTNLKAGNSNQGASTLTQQYVERTRLDTTKSYAGKAREAIIALKIAETTPKEEVLEGYLNTIYWGRGTYGIQTASQEYFSKDAKDMTPSEAALLAGIIPSPVNWDPSVNPKQAKIRWQRSIDHMYEQGYITKDEHDKAEFPKFNKKKEASNTQSGQTGYLLAQVKRELTKTDDNPDGKYTAEELETRGLRITTTIEPKLQNAAVDVEKSLHQVGPYGKASDKARMSLVSVDPQTGAIKALYGGPDFVKQWLNTATQDIAQAGSTFKPFTLIGALEEGYSLSDTFDGHTPQSFDNGTWDVGNFSGEQFGNIDLTTATAHSVNTVYAQLNEEIGPEKTAEVAHKAGIRDSTNIEAVPSNVLGTASVYPVDLASAYATIAAGGYRTTPHLVQKVETLDGTTVYEGPTAQTKEFDPDVMAAATYAMTKVVEDGSGRTAQELGRPVAGKTGTSNDNVAAWFAGFVPQLATVVNVRQYKELDLDAGVMKGQEPIDSFGDYEEITGGSWPARAWTDFMKVATEGMDVEQFPTYTPPTPTYSPTPSPSPSPTEEEMVDVPGDLVGKDVAEATQTLEGLGLVVRTQAQNDDAPKGQVLQASSAGSQVPPGTQILLLVSTGQPDQPEQVVVPDVTGQSRSAAEQQLRKAGLSADVAEEPSNDVAPGAVIRTEPGPNESVEPGSSVRLVVSSGPEQQEKPTPTPTETDDGGTDGDFDDLLGGN